VDRTISATEARVHFGELLRSVVERDEAVVVERGGKPRVVVVSVGKYERLLAAQEDREDWRELVQRSRDQVRADLGGSELTPPADVLRDSREERDDQLVAVR
jgi:prevent-host-death family protein